MAFLAGLANIAIYTKFKTFATMLTGNTLWMAVALTQGKFLDVAFYLAVITAYMAGTAIFRRTDLSLQQQTLPVSAALVATAFVVGDAVHYATSTTHAVLSKWIPVMLFAMGFGVINSLGMEVTGALNFVVTGHYTKLINVLVDRLSRTAGRKPLTEAQRKAAIQNGAICGGFVAGAVFASILMGYKVLNRFGIFSAIGLAHAVLWLVHDMEALGGAWWLRKGGAMCDIIDNGELCDLPNASSNEGETNNVNSGDATSTTPSSSSTSAKES
jgi:uncharacterized membrane protein YoaK (UPF0700 family)